MDKKSVEIVSAKDFQANKYKIHAISAKFHVPNDNNNQQILWTDENRLAIVNSKGQENKLCLYRIINSNDEVSIELE